MTGHVHSPVSKSPVKAEETERGMAGHDGGHEDGAEEGKVHPSSRNGHHGGEAVAEEEALVRGTAIRAAAEAEQKRKNARGLLSSGKTSSGH